MSKFHDDPMVDESGIVVLLGQILGLYEKRESYDAKNISLTSDIIVSQIERKKWGFWERKKEKWNWEEEEA